MISWPLDSKYSVMKASPQLLCSFYSGLLQLQGSDYDRLNDNDIDPSGVKVVLGPGTGHGQGFLVKSRFSPCYEVFPTEGGHVEFSPRNAEDMKIVDFAYNYLETSRNVENERNLNQLDKIRRISHERLGAGPGLPLLYEYYKKQNPEM